MTLLSEIDVSVDSNSSYLRLFGDTELARIFIKAQSATIRAGNDLETRIFEKIPEKSIVALDNIIQLDRTSIAYKPKICKGCQPDFVVHANECLYVIEIKAGCVFDTKKSEAEVLRLQDAAKLLFNRFNAPTDYKIVSFYEADKRKVMTGFKNKLDMAHIMTGKEFCILVGIDYLSVSLPDFERQALNREYVLNSILKLAKESYSGE